MKKGFILAIAMVATMFSANAQNAKFGYTNSTAILAEMPEVKSAESTIETFGKQLQKQGQEMVTSLQNKYQDLAKKEKAGELSPKQLNDAQAELKKEEEEIGKYEQEMQAKVGEKRTTLLQPILDRVNKAIADVAKENGYAYIFDATTSVLLYADETADVTKLINTKLGIVTTTKPMAAPGKN